MDPASVSQARPALLTVSGEIAEDRTERIAAGLRPRKDYDELAVALPADLLDHPTARRMLGRAGSFVRRLLGPDVALAIASFRLRKRHRLVLTDGEQVGLPFAALCRLTRHRPRHVMIAHRLSAPKKVLVHRVLRLQRTIDLVIVYASSQRRFAIEHLGYPADAVVLHPFMVDTEFWCPDRVVPSAGSRPLICAVGQEMRDYPTLVSAVRGLDADVVLAAASPWSKRPDSAADIDLPPNVTVRAYDQYELRQLYADASLVVVPLEETDFQAGITTILEAMSMARPIVCTATTGQTDTIVAGRDGCYVPPGDAEGLRTAIEALLSDPEQRARMGASGQRWARSRADVEVYARELAALALGDGP
jgi:glycosyltransferase involved in cell wall biosynthesis